jgi:hypothetical protein
MCSGVMAAQTSRNGTPEMILGAQTMSVSAALSTVMSAKTSGASPFEPAEKTAAQMIEGRQLGVYSLTKSAHYRHCLRPVPGVVTDLFKEKKPVSKRRGLELADQCRGCSVGWAAVGWVGI